MKTDDVLEDLEFSWRDLYRLPLFGLLTILLLLFSIFLVVGFIGGPVWLSILICSWL